MTTVGYGDFYPVTTLGYVVGVICALAGLIATALPVAVIGNQFNIYWEHNIKRRQRMKVRGDDQRSVSRISVGDEQGQTTKTKL